MYNITISNYYSSSSLFYRLLIQLKLKDCIELRKNVNDHLKSKCMKYYNYIRKLDIFLNSFIYVLYAQLYHLIFLNIQYSTNHEVIHFS